MLRNYLKIALRNLLKNPMYSFLNIIGLSLGLSVSFLIVLFVTHELSYDRFHEKSDVIVKAGLEEGAEGGKWFVPWMSYSFGEAVQRNCPEVKDFARLRFEENKKIVRIDAMTKFFEEGIVFADNGFLRLFSFGLLKGNPKTALVRPATVLITPEIAKKYFKNTDPIGKMLVFDNKYPLEVTGIIQQAPTNSSIQYSIVISLETYRNIEREIIASYYKGKGREAELQRVGASGGYSTYFQIASPKAVAAVEKKLPAIVSGPPASPQTRYYLERLADMHLYSRDMPRTQLALVYTLSGVALLLLLLAIANYINLTTARYTVRAKEIAVRKLTGAFRQSVIYQFYVESFFHVLLAVLVALLIFSVSRSGFLNTLGIKIESDFFNTRYFLLPLLAVFVGSVIVSGSYPALFLSRFSPVQLLTGKFGVGKGSVLVRRSLTVFQLCISTGLLVGSLVIYRQLHYILTKDIGIDRDNVVVINLEEGMDTHYRSIRQQIEQVPGVDAVTCSSLPLFQNYLNSWDVKIPGSSKTISVNSFPVDEHFVEVMNVRWKMKPSISDFFIADGVIVNETAAQRLKLTEKSYRQELSLDDKNHKTLLGVVRDFNYQSLRQPARPMMFFVAKDTMPRQYLYVKLDKAAQASVVLASLEKTYNRFKKDKPFDCYFLDEAFDRLYEMELRLQKMILAFTVVAIVIACFGLFGLAAFTAKTRTKEIGIRKVLGASVSQIVVLLSRDFVKLLLLSFLVSVPVAWYVMHQWLQGFAYRIEISWRIFALTGILALLIALITVSFQAVKAALANPVKSLRSE